MATASSTNLFIFYWQASQVISGHYIKRNLANRSFHLVKYGNLTKTVYILSTYIPVGWNFSKVVPFGGGWSDIWSKKHCPLLKIILLKTVSSRRHTFAFLNLLSRILDI